MKVLVENAPFTLLPTTNTINNSGYKAIIQKKETNPYVPKPYSNIGKLSPEKAQKLCKSLGVDAVLGITYQFRESLRAPLCTKQ